MLHAASDGDLTELLEKFLKLCNKRRLYVIISKSTFYLKKTSWCERMIDAKGVWFDPRNVSGLTGKKLPKIAGEVCKFVHGVSWLSTAIPKFSERRAPFRELLGAYVKVRSRKKNQ